MRSNVKLSTRFLTTQDAHQVGLLVTVAGEAPAERPPINGDREARGTGSGEVTGCRRVVYWLCRSSQLQ